MGFLQRSNAFRTGQQANKLDGLRVKLLEPLNGCNGGVASSQHRVDHHNVALFHVMRHLEVVLNRCECFGVTVQTNMTNPSTRHHAEHAFKNTVASTQDGHKNQFFAVDNFAGGGFKRCFDFDVLHRHVARDLVSHQHAELIEQRAKRVGGGVFAAHQRQLVLHQWVINQVNFVVLQGHFFCFF